MLQVQEIINLLKSLPKPPDVDVVLFDSNLFRCSGCGKVFHVKHMRIIKSPYMYKNGNNVLDPICHECAKNTKDFSLLVDPNLQRVVARIEPHRDVTGFVFKPGQIYHIDVSPKSDNTLPEFLLEDKKVGSLLLSSIIIEKKIYDEQHKKLII